MKNARSDITGTQNTKKRVYIGKIVAAHGVKGLVKILPCVEDLSLLNSKLYNAETGGEPLKIKLQNPIGKYRLARIEGVNDRTMAEDISGTALYIDRAQLPKIKEKDSFYYSDLIGLKAMDENGEEAGEVIDMQNFGAGDLFEIRPPTGKSYYLPYTEHYVEKIDLKTLSLHIKNHGEMIIE